MKPEEK
ncbi:hypothetical protein RDI58_003851 [Solanum bulbocastanum]